MTADNHTPDNHMPDQDGIALDGTVLENTGPWGSPPSGGGGNDGGNKGGGKNPWGQGPQRGNGGGPRGNGPDLDDMLRQAQNRFRGGMGGGAGGMPPHKAFFGIVLLLALLWLGTGFYRVEPGEHAVKMTFGAWQATRAEPGLGYHIPWPIQSVEKVDVAIDRKVEVSSRNNTSNSMMLTGDENIADINFVVLWRISDAAKFQFKIADPERTVEKVAESAMREIIGRTPIQSALTEGRADIEVQTKDLMQRILDEYEAGVVINNVQLLRVDPPQVVVDAFNDVQRARTDKERMRNEAETYRNDIVPRARGDAQKLLQDAGAYKEAVISKAEGDAARFLSVYKAYAMAKDVTLKRIYIETMQDILTSSRKILVGDERGVPVLPYMQLEQPKSAQK